MAATDTTALILKILQQMEVINQQMEEQRRADLQATQEQRLATKERSPRDMQRMLQELQIGRASATTRPPTEAFPSLKIDFKEFSNEPEDWNTWSRVHQAQLSALGCAEALSAKDDHDIKIWSDDFDSSSVDSERLRTAHQASVWLITTCEGVAFDNVQRAESPGEAWRRLVQHYRASGLKEWRRLTVDFYTMKMEGGATG